MHRREFLKTAGGALALAALATPALAAAAQESEASTRKRTLKKGIMWGTVDVKGSTLEKMKAIKEAGFDGAEMMSHMDQDEVMRARDETGLVIPSVCGRDHWKKPLSDPDPKVREEGLESLRGEAGGEERGVFLGDADIEVFLGMGLGEMDQAGAGRHRAAARARHGAARIRSHRPERDLRHGRSRSRHVTGSAARRAWP